MLKLINTAEAAILESPMIYRLQSYQDYQTNIFAAQKMHKFSTQILKFMAIKEGFSSKPGKLRQQFL